MDMDIEESQEFEIVTSSGRLHARCWTPKQAAAIAPIVLIHDSLGSVELWRGFPANLAVTTGRRVIAYDRMGFGRSDPRSDILNLGFIEREAEGDFATILNYFTIDQFIVMGHSVGGAMALCIAAFNEDRCLAVIAESAQTFAEDVTLNGIREAKKTFESHDQMKRLCRYHGSKAEWVLSAWTETWLAPQFANWSLECTLPKIRCPVLVIRGGSDEYGSSAHSRMIAACVHGPVQFNEMEGVGHVPHRELPTEVHQMVAIFCKRVG